MQTAHRTRILGHLHDQVPATGLVLVIVAAATFWLAVPIVLASRLLG